MSLDTKLNLESYSTLSSVGNDLDEILRSKRKRILVIDDEPENVTP
jgi:hypothetical protein